MIVISSFWLSIDKINTILIMFLDFFYSQSLRTNARYLTGYISLLIGLFITLVILNILGLVPYIFSTTAHLAITLRIALPL
jgi:F0F1-type ATP synthase membrane subunit a